MSTHTHKHTKCTHAHTLHRHTEVCVQVVFGLQIMHFKVIYSTLHYIVAIKEICKFRSIKAKMLFPVIARAPLVRQMV